MSNAIEAIELAEQGDLGAELQLYHHWRNPMSDQRMSIDRRQLYELVWSKPMIHAAVDFGISGNGLAKVCRKLDVPYPARGYWAKLAVGKGTSGVWLIALFRRRWMSIIHFLDSPSRAEFIQGKRKDVSERGKGCSPRSRN